jgi:hypothetical protein
VCSDPNFPFCDKDGLIEGEPNTCISVTCKPGDLGACDGSDALVCNAAGSSYDLNECLTGCAESVVGGCNGCTPNSAQCNGSALERCGSDGTQLPSETCGGDCIADGTPHCEQLEPVYLGNVCDTPATGAARTFNDPEMFDVDNDANCSATIPQAGGPTICVVRAPTIDITTTAVLSVISSANQAGGSNGRAIAFVADDSLTVDGTLDASANLFANGPGGGFTISGAAHIGGVGGGGAGFHTAGGNGNGTTNGGVAEQDPARSPVIVGGPAAASGGGGGGAVLLVACRGTVSVTGTVSLGGGGGLGGGASHLVPYGGQGGGAGGYLVVQGLRVGVTGNVFANGGAGASGGSLTAIKFGSAGQTGQASTTAALGGASVDTSGVGGNGGVGTTAPGNGLGGASNTGDGGGGGSVGFLQTYTPTGVDATVTPKASSPAFQANAPTLTTK